MTRHLCFSTIAVLVGIFCCVAAGYAETPFVINLDSDHNSFAVGADVPIDITLTNISDGVLEITYTRIPPVDFVPEVNRADGKRPTGLAPLVNAVNPAVVHGGSTTDKLEPKEIVKERMILNQLFDLTEPGIYIVQVSRRAAGGSVVRSNKLTVLITR